MEHLTLPGSREGQGSLPGYSIGLRFIVPYDGTRQRDMVVESAIQAEETECVKPQRDGNKTFLLQKY